MAKIKWTPQTEIDQIKEDLEKFKGRDYQALTQAEKDELIEKIARQLGYL